MDLLVEQDALQREIFKSDLKNLHGEALEKAVFEMSIALYGEISEFCEAMKLLPWKKTGKPNLEIAIEELIDIQHFLNNLYLLCGITTEAQMKEKYMKKLLKNKERGKIHENASHIH